MSKRTILISRIISLILMIGGVFCFFLPFVTSYGPQTPSDLIYVHKYFTGFSLAFDFSHTNTVIGTNGSNITIFLSLLVSIGLLIYMLIADGLFISDCYKTRGGKEEIDLKKKDSFSINLLILILSVNPILAHLFLTSVLGHLAYTEISLCYAAYLSGGLILGAAFIRFLPSLFRVIDNK